MFEHLSGCIDCTTARECLIDGGRPLTVHLVPLDRPAAQWPFEFGCGTSQLGQQHVGEERVIAEDAGDANRHDEDVARTDQLLEMFGTARMIEHEIAQVAGKPIEHRGADEELPLGVGKRPQELLLEVRGQELCALRRWVLDLVVVRAAEAEHDELNSGGPPSKLIDHRSPIGAVGELVEEGVGLVSGEEQIRGLDRIECAGEVESGGSDRRRGSTGQHDPALQGKRLDDRVEDMCGIGLGDEVDIVQHEDERRSDAELFVELGDRPGRGSRSDVTGDAQEPGVGYDGVQRGQDSAEKADRVVVAAVERQPCGLTLEAFAPSAQHRRLAVAGSGDDEDDRPVRSVEALEETIASERSVVRARWGQPVRRDTELGG